MSVWWPFSCVTQILRVSGMAEVKRLRDVVTDGHHVDRKIHCLSPNEPWVTDITENPTRESKVCCCCVLDTFSRRIVGWSIDSIQNMNLVVNALGMAIKIRHRKPGGVVHAERTNADSHRVTHG